jgi:GMP synthase-like glutamine amidotransferase
MRHDPDRAGHGRTAVALRHVAFEDLGLIASILEESGFRTSYCDVPIEDLDDPSIASADLLIVLGGPIGAYDTAARNQARRIFAEWLEQIVQFDDRAAATRTGSAR